MEFCLFFLACRCCMWVRLLFDLAGLRTVYYRPERDLISPAFKPSRRVVAGGLDFDALVKP